MTAFPAEHKLVLEARDIVAGYLPEVDILRGVTVEVGRSEIVTIVGPNGAGKSTLARVIIGLLPPREGMVRLDDRAVTGFRPHRIVAHGVGYVSQRDNVFPTLTVEENLELGATLGRVEFADRLPALFDLFPRLRERRRQVAGTLSGGERQMLALARTLVASPHLLVLDEPSAGLSPLAIDAIFEKIIEINAAGVAMLLVEQNARRALALSDRGYVLDMGQNRFTGVGRELLHDPRIVELYLGGSGRIEEP